MGALRKRKFDINIRADGNEKNAFPALGDAVIGGVKYAVHHTVVQAIRFSKCVISLKPRNMIHPALFSGPGYFGVH